MVRALLVLSRLESVQPVQTTESLDLAALARETAERYASQAEQAGLIFELEVDDEPAIIVAGNREQIAQAIGNLLDNAIKFSMAGGAVRMVVSQTESLAELRVEDTGIGIPAEDLPELFQRFHRGRNSAAYPGNGLGLAIVKRVVERHGGWVQVESREEGTCFRIWLPVRQHPR